MSPILWCMVKNRILPFQIIHDQIEDLLALWTYCHLLSNHQNLGKRRRNYRGQYEMTPPVNTKKITTTCIFDGDVCSCEL